MLTEARVDSDQIRDLVFGLGMNVNSPPAGWPADLARRAVSLGELAGAPLDLNRLTAALIGRVLLAYGRLRRGARRDLRRPVAPLSTGCAAAGRPCWRPGAPYRGRHRGRRRRGAAPARGRRQDAGGFGRAR